MYAKTSSCGTIAELQRIRVNAKLRVALSSAGLMPVAAAEASPAPGTAVAVRSLPLLGCSCFNRAADKLPGLLQLPLGMLMAWLLERMLLQSLVLAGSVPLRAAATMPDRPLYLVGSTQLVASCAMGAGRCAWCYEKSAQENMVGVRTAKL